MLYKQGYDMENWKTGMICKAASKDIEITDVSLEHKSGGLVNLMSKELKCSELKCSQKNINVPIHNLIVYQMYQMYQKRIIKFHNMNL